MRVKRYCTVFVLAYLVVLVSSICADTHITFQTTKYYSSSRRYFVVVTEKKRAILYRNDRRLRRVWARSLPELPQRLFVTNDGKRIVIVDRYYGNACVPETPVVIILDEKGNQIASHRLGDVANLKRVVQTISAAHWYSDARLEPGDGVLVIETIVTKLDWDECLRIRAPEEKDKCRETVPWEQLRFALSSGKLIERVSLASR